MAASPDEMRRSIDIGSLPFGTRQAFESSLGDLGAAQPAPVGARQAQADEELGTPGNPLDPMLAGEQDPGNLPLTAGMSVGPGPGVLGSAMEPISGSIPDRLRILALNAASPVLREMARNALRGTVREARGG